MMSVHGSREKPLEACECCHLLTCNDKTPCCYSNENFDILKPSDTTTGVAAAHSQSLNVNDQSISGPAGAATASTSDYTSVFSRSVNFDASRSTATAANDLAWNLPPKIQHHLDEPIALILFKTGFLYVIGTLVAVPVLCLILIAYPVAILVRCCYYIAKHRRLTNIFDSVLQETHCDAHWPQSAALLDPVAIYTAVLPLDGYLDCSDVRQLLWRKLLNLRDRYQRLIHPRFSQIPKEDCCGMIRWQYDATFDIINHVTVYQSNDARHCAMLHSQIGLERVVSELSSQPLFEHRHPVRPLWHCYVLQRSNDQTAALFSVPNTTTGGSLPSQSQQQCRTAGDDAVLCCCRGGGVGLVNSNNATTVLVFRMHSLLLDRLCLPKLLCTLNDTDVMFVYEPKLPHSKSLKLWAILQAILLGPLAFFSDLFRIGCFTRLQPSVSAITNYLKLYGKKSIGNLSAASDYCQFQLAWGRVPATDQLLRAQKLLHCSLEELLLSFVAGTIQKVCRQQDLRHPPDLHISLPISLNNFSDVAARQRCLFSVLPIRLPVGVEGAIPRVWETQRAMEDALDGPLVYGQWASSYLLGRILPPAFAQRLFSRQKSQTTFASVSFLRGSLNPSSLTRVSDLSLNSRRINSALLFASASPLSFTFMQLGKEVTMAVAVDSSAMNVSTSAFRPLNSSTPIEQTLGRVVLSHFRSQIVLLLNQISARLMSPLFSSIMAPPLLTALPAARLAHAHHVPHKSPLTTSMSNASKKVKCENGKTAALTTVTFVAANRHSSTPSSHTHYSDAIDLPSNTGFDEASGDLCLTTTTLTSNHAGVHRSAGRSVSTAMSSTSWQSVNSGVDEVRISIDPTSNDSALTGAALSETSCSSVGETSLEELETLLQTVQNELASMRQAPDENREIYLARLSDFEWRMESLQRKITEKLLAANRAGINGFLLDAPEQQWLKALASSLDEPSSSSTTDAHGKHHRKRKRSFRRTSSPTAAHREHLTVSASNSG